MQKNIVEDYIMFVEKNIQQYLKLIFPSKYDDTIAKEYIRSYINVRYYNYECDEEEPKLTKRIEKALKEKSKQLIEKYPNKEEVITNMLIGFEHIMIIDRAKKAQLKPTIVDLAKKRATSFQIDVKDDFQKNFYAMAKDHLAQQDLYLKSFDSKDFKLCISKVQNQEALFLTDLKYEYQFPTLYSQEFLKETLNAHFLKEDMLKIQYIMLSVVYLKEAIKGEFANKYIVDFSHELLNKKKKIRQQLRFISDLVSQDKTYLKVPSSIHFTKKESIYELMREGYQFAVEIDNKFSPTQANLKELNLFQCILISAQNPKYDLIKKAAQERKYIIVEI